MTEDSPITPQKRKNERIKALNSLALCMFYVIISSYLKEIGANNVYT